MPCMAETRQYPRNPVMDKVTLAMEVPDMKKGENVPEKLAKAVSALPSVNVGDREALPDDGFIMGVAGDTAFIAGNKAWVFTDYVKI